MSDIVTEHRGKPICSYDRDTIREAAAEAVKALDRGEPITSSLAPGNGVIYHILLTPVDGQFRNEVGNDWVLSIVNFRKCYTVGLYGTQAPEYLADKLDLAIADACVIADFLVALAAEVAVL